MLCDKLFFFFLMFFHFKSNIQIGDNSLLSVYIMDAPVSSVILEPFLDCIIDTAGLNMQLVLSLQD